MNQDSIFKGFALIGSIILIICVFPQLIKTFKTKTAKDISTRYLILTIIGLTFLAIYATYFKLTELYIPNYIQIFLFSLILFMKKYYGNVDILSSSSSSSL